MPQNFWADTFIRFQNLKLKCFNTSYYFRFKMAPDVAELTFSVRLDTSSLLHFIVDQICTSKKHSNKNSNPESTFSIIDDGSQSKMGTVSMKIVQNAENTSSESNFSSPAINLSSLIDTRLTSNQNVGVSTKNNGTSESNSADYDETASSRFSNRPIVGGISDESSVSLNPQSVLNVVKNAMHGSKKESTSRPFLENSREEIPIVSSSVKDNELSLKGNRQQPFDLNRPGCSSSSTQWNSVQPLVELVSSISPDVKTEATCSSTSSDGSVKVDLSTSRNHTPPCNKSRVSSSEVIGSLVTSPDQIHKCSKCAYETWSKKYLLQHHRNQHANLFVYCAYCATPFRQKYLLRRHYVGKHGLDDETAQTVLDSVDYISCDDTEVLCGSRPKRMKNCDSDLMEILNSLKSDHLLSESETNETGQILNGNPILRSRLSLAQSENNHVCALCMFSSENVDSLKSHYVNSHKLDLDTTEWILTNSQNRNSSDTSDVPGSVGNRSNESSASVQMCAESNSTAIPVQVVTNTELSDDESCFEVSKDS